MALIVFNATDVIHDINVLAQAYRDLPAGLVKKQLRSAMKKAIEPWRPEFRKAAPKGKTGNLRKSVQVISKFDRAYGFFAKVGYARSKGKKGHHAMLVHDGTDDRFTKGGIYRGRVVGSRFAEPIANKIRTQGYHNFQLHVEAAIEAGYRQLEKYVAARARTKAKRGF